MTTALLKADTTARRRAVYIFLCCAVIGFGAVLAVLEFRPTIEAWVVQDPALEAPRIRLVFSIIGIFIALPPSGLAVCLWRLGRSIVRTKQFPPLGVVVIRDTPILRDQAARNRGLALQLVAIFLIIAACIQLRLLWLLADSLEANMILDTIREAA